MNFILDQKKRIELNDSANQALGRSKGERERDSDKGVDRDYS